MRRPHYIKANNSAEYPHQCIWFDTETELHDRHGKVIPLSQWKKLGIDPDDPRADNLQVTHHLTFGYACYERRHRDGKWTDTDWIKFTARSEFWEWALSKIRDKTKLYIFCHNTSFDLPVLNVFSQLPSHGFSLRSAIIDAPPTILTFSHGAKSVVILDTLNIWRMPLKFLGETIGLPKLDMPDNNDLTVEWETYGRRDVEIIRAACLNWFTYLEQNDMGGFAVTLASQAMKIYRRKYMRHKIFIDTNPKALELTRKGYYGGRVECFRIGKYTGIFYACDVNSMYLSVMRDNKFPCKLLAATSYASVEDIRIWLQKYSVTAKVTLRSDRAFAPFRTKSKLIFPIGEFQCTLSTPELVYALKYCEITEVHEVAVYENELLFTDFVNANQAIKEKAKRSGDLVGEWHAKKWGNSFYGKWGQSGTKWMEQDWIEDLTCKAWIELDMETGQRINHRQLGGLRQVKLTDGESRDSFPAIAAHVTAYARMRLWELIEQAGTRNVYYCDTDCVVVNQTGYDMLVSEMDNYRLGMLKLAGQYDDIEIWGSKDYRFGSKQKTKGVRKDAWWLDGHRIQQEQWSGLRGLVAKGQTDAPQTRKVIKNLKRIYDKGWVLADGTVLPHRLDSSSPELLLHSEMVRDDPFSAESL